MFNRRGLNNLSAAFGRFSRKFGGSSNGHGHGHGHGHEDFHVPEFHAKLGKVVLVSTYLWILYRFKEDRGQIFGIYKPWLHEHHHEHLHYTESENEGDSMPILVEHEDDHGDDEEHEHEDEEEEEE